MPLVKVLNVAEKNDAAKNIAQVLSSGRSQRVSFYIFQSSNTYVCVCTMWIVENDLRKDY